MTTSAAEATHARLDDFDGRAPTLALIVIVEGAAGASASSAPLRTTSATVQSP